MNKVNPREGQKPRRRPNPQVADPTIGRQRSGHVANIELSALRRRVDELEALLELATRRASLELATRPSRNDVERDLGDAPTRPGTSHGEASETWDESDVKVK